MVPRLLSAAVTAGTFLLCAFACEAATERPNILFIYTDDQSYRTVGCYPEAYDWVRTPNIDALARSGVRFTHAYIGTWCMPSRATLLTGHHPYGVESMRMKGEYPGSVYDPQQCPFWPRVFRRHGYVTAQIGKWHTGVDAGFGRDWDYQAVWNRPRYPSNAGHYYYDQLIEFNGGPPVKVPGYSTDNYTRWAEEFIRGKNRPGGKPWYLWLCYGAVHGPFTPAERHRDAYPDVTIPVPRDIYPPRPGKPAYMQLVDYWQKGPDGHPVMRGGGFQALTVDTRGIHGNRLVDWVRQYHQGVLAIDEGVGRLMAALRETGQMDNTLIVFTSDQGFAWGQHGFRTKLAPYDANIRSPLIISMQGRVSAGGVCPHPVSGADLVPTFFAFAGIPLPWKMHGHDLTPLLRRPTAEWPYPALTALTGRRFGSDTDHIPRDPRERDINGIPWWVSLAQGHFKYIRTLVPNEIEELYDLRSDPDELHNLAGRPEFRERLRRMREQTIAELKRTGAGFADALPPVRTVESP